MFILLFNELHQNKILISVLFLYIVFSLAACVCFSPIVSQTVFDIFCPNTISNYCLGCRMFCWASLWLRINLMEAMSYFGRSSANEVPNNWITVQTWEGPT